MIALLVAVIALPALARAGGYARVAAGWWTAARRARPMLHPPKFGYVRIEEVPDQDRIHWP